MADATVGDEVIFDQWPDRMKELATRVILSRAEDKVSKPVDAMIGENIRDARSAAAALERGDVRAAKEAMTRIERRSIDDFVVDQ